MNICFLCPICKKKLGRGFASDVVIGHSLATEMHSVGCQFHYFRQVIDGNNTILLSIEISLGLIETRDMRSTMGLEYQADIHDNLTITNYYQENLPVSSRQPHSVISRLPSSRYQVDKPFRLTLIPDRQTIDANTVDCDRLFDLDFPNLTQTIKKVRTLLFFN